MAAEEIILTHYLELQEIQVKEMLVEIQLQMVAAEAEAEQVQQEEMLLHYQAQQEV